jgi:hypothetical protein
MTQPQAIRQDVFQDIVQDIRRRRDGSIDVDFYRADAIALRNRAIREHLQADGARQGAHAVQAMANASGAAGERPADPLVSAGAKTPTS